MSNTSLDHLYPVGGSDGNIKDLEAKVAALETKTTNLGNITAKTNLTNTFTTNQTINGVWTQKTAATQDNHLTRRVDVKNMIGSWVQLQQWSGNFKTTTLQWTKTAQFSTAGVYEFRIVIKYNGKFYNTQFTLKIDLVADTIYSPVFWINWGNENAGAIQNVPNSGFYFVYSNKLIKLIKVGQNQPEAGTELIIYYRGVS